MRLTTLPGMNQTAERFLADECERVEVSGIDYVSIPVGRLRRSIDFYSRHFGFVVVEDAHNEDHRAVLLRTSGNLHLAIYERRGAEPAARRWSFVVDDLDRVRETIWNLGLPTKDACDEPTRVHHWRRNRSFFVCDPDGHEIELVERCSPSRLRCA